MHRYNFKEHIWAAILWSSNTNYALNWTGDLDKTYRDALRRVA